MIFVRMMVSQTYLFKNDDINNNNNNDNNNNNNNNKNNNNNNNNNNNSSEIFRLTSCSCLSFDLNLSLCKKTTCKSKVTFNFIQAQGAGRGAEVEHFAASIFLLVIN